jgi:hypothetical protein
VICFVAVMVAALPSKHDASSRTDKITPQKLQNLYFYVSTLNQAQSDEEASSASSSHLMKGLT